MLLLDADAVCKLANWQLLEDLPDLVAVVPGNMMVISSLVHRANRSLTKLDKRLFADEIAAQQTVSFLTKTTKLPEPDPARMAVFQDVADIDAGEAILFALLLQCPESKVLTGDKRAIRGLINIPKDVRASLTGRFICLEQIVAKALSVFGLEQIREKICPRRNIDRSIANAMGSRCDATHPAVEEGLSSYINELHRLYEPALLATLT